LTTKITFQSPKVGSIIEYRFLYSNEEPVVGVVLKIEDDVNFYKIIHCLTDLKTIDFVPLSMIEFKILEH